MKTLQKLLKELGLPLVGFMLLTILLTYPVFLNISTCFMGDGYDGFQNAWNLWWVKTALTKNFTNPYFTEYLHHPNGVTLLFHTLNPFNGLISIPLQPFFRMEIVYNVIVFFSFIMSGIGMYILAFYLTKNKFASLIAGIIYTFCPYHMAHALGHLQLIAMEWIPFYIFFLLKLLQEPERKNILWCSFFLILTTFCSWYYLLYSLFFTAILISGAAIKRRRGFLLDGTLTRLIVMLVIVFGVLSPLIVSMIITGTKEVFLGTHNPENFSADLTSFFVPSAISTWGRMWCRNIWSTWSGNTAENSNFLGYTVLALSIYAAIRVRKTRIWGVAGIFAFIMALGPYLHVMGRQIRVPLPYLFFHKYVPYFSMTGVPERFDLMLKFSMAILSAYAVAHITKTHFHSGAKSSRNVIFPLTVAGLICLEYLTIPYPMTRVSVPEFYRQMAKDTEEYAIIDIPDTPLTLYYATIHEKPIVGGYVSRLPVKTMGFLYQTPIISTLICGTPSPAPEKLDEAIATLREYNIRYILTHNNRHRKFLEQTLRLKKIYDQQHLQVYDLRLR
ncbi:hypothetical protein ACFLS1_06005 [Verrucomicrobiota bacterium]